MIEFLNLSKRYGPDVLAVRRLSLTVAPGEIYALLGPNGAGKTTALRCLATLLRPTSGTARIGDADVLHDPLECKRRLGFLSESMGLYERLTPREVVSYFGRLHGLDGEVLEERVEEVLGRFGALPFSDRYCGALSTGQKQRVSLARALVHSPPALVLDEPTSGLDVLSGEGIYRFLREARDGGRAILFSTHRMEEVELLADRVGLLRAGSLVAEGTVPELIERSGQDNLTMAFLHYMAEEVSA